MANTLHGVKLPAGMEFVDKIKKGDSRGNGKVDFPDIIVKMQVAADAKDEKPAPGSKV